MKRAFRLSLIAVAAIAGAAVALAIPTPQLRVTEQAAPIALDRSASACTCPAGRPPSIAAMQSKLSLT